MVPRQEVDLYLLFQHLTPIDYKFFFTPPIYDMAIKTHNKMSQY